MSNERDVSGLDDLFLPSSFLLMSRLLREASSFVCSSKSEAQWLLCGQGISRCFHASISWVLVALSAHGLSETLGTFSEFADVVDLKLNGAKSQCCVFGRQSSSQSFINVAGVELLNCATKLITDFGIDIKSAHK